MLLWKYDELFRGINIMPNISEYSIALLQLLVSVVTDLIIFKWNNCDLKS